MKALRSLLLCGCTADEPVRCAHKTWLSNGCLCPCHFSTEKTHRLLSAYLAVGGAETNGFLRRRLSLGTAGSPASGALTIHYSCGHERHFDVKPSMMAMGYIRQNRCEKCREELERAAI